MSINQKNRFFRLLLLVFASQLGCLSSASGQIAMEVNPETEILTEARNLYLDQLFGLAQERYNNYLGVPAQIRSVRWETHKVEAVLYASLCGLWLEQDDAVHELRQTIDEFRPDPMAHQVALEVGNAYSNEKQYRQANEYYNSIDLSTAHPSMVAEVTFKRGYAYFSMKQNELALPLFETSIGIQSEYFYPSHYYLGMIQFHNNEYAEAIDHFESASESKKFSSHIPYYLTQIYFDQSNYQQVIDYATNQVETSAIENKLEIQNLIGRSHYELGNDEKALRYLREYEKEVGDISTTDHYQLGILAYKEGSYTEAIKHLKPLASEKDKTSIHANYYLGHSFLQSGNKTAARSAFANVGRRSSDPKLKEEAIYNYGLLSAGMRFDREAVNALISIAPTSDYFENAQDVLVNLFLKTEDYDNALIILDDIDKSNPRLKEAYQKVNYYKGKQLADQNYYQAALPFLTQSLKYAINPDIQLKAIFEKANAYHTTGHFQQSIAQLNTLATLSQTTDKLQAMASYVQGYNYLKLGKLPEATAGFLQALSGINQSAAINQMILTPHVHSDVLNRLGDCAFQANLYDDALTYYKQSYGMKKNGFIYAYYQSALIYGLHGDPIQKIVILEDLQKKYSTAGLADDALLESAHTYLSLAKYDEAASPLLLLTKNYKNSDLITQAYLTLGLISYNKGGIPQSITYYKSLFNHNPSAGERKDALNALQEIYLNDIKDVDQYFNFLEEVSGNSPDVQIRDSLSFQSAYNSYANTEYDDAITGLNKYLTQFPNGINKIEAHYIRAECLVLQSDYSNAYRDYTKVINFGGSNYYQKALRKAALIAYNEIKNFERSFDYYSALLKLNNSQADKISAIMGAMRSAHRIDKDDNVLRLAADLHELEGVDIKIQLSADYFSSKIYYARGLHSEALLTLNRISKNGTDEFAAESRYLIAQIYLEQNELAIAESMAQLAIKENANYSYWVAKSIILLSDIFSAKGDYFNAKAALEAVIENFTENGELNQNAKEKLKAIEHIETPPAQDSSSSNNNH